MKTELISGWDGAMALRDDWRNLHRSKGTFGAHLFNDFDYLDIWQEYFGDDRDLFILTARDDEGTLVGLAALQRQVRKAGPFSYRRMGMIQNEFISRSSVMVNGDPEVIAPALAALLIENAHLYEDLVFEHMLADCPAQIALRRTLEDAGWMTSMELDERPLRTVIFDGDEDAYVQTRRRKMRINFNRSLRRCGELPDFSVKVSTAPENAANLMRRMFSLDWMSGKRLRPGAIYPPLAKEFHLQLAERADDIGGVEFVEAWSGDRLIASIFSVRNLHAQYLLVTYSDANYNASSPGLLVILRAVGTGLSHPDIRIVDLNGDSSLLERISTDLIQYGVFKANHRRPFSLLIGAARKAKAFLSGIRSRTLKTTIPDPERAET